MTQRVTHISVGSRNDGDMYINVPKTENMLCVSQMVLPTIAEMKKTEANYAHECCFCVRRFKTK